MTPLIVACVLLGASAVAVLAWPMRRDARVAATVSALLLAVGSAGLYAVWSNWQPPAAETPGAGQMGAPAEMIGRLARRLESKPDDLEGWLMLGRSYGALEQYPLASRAFQRADRVAGGASVEALTGWAEALVLQNDNEIEGRAGRLFERALAIDPNAPKALFFAAAAAQRRGEWVVARERFARLLELGAPPEIRPMLEQQVAALDAQIAAGASASADPAGRADPNGRAGGPSGPAAAAPVGAAIRLRIALSPQLQSAAAGTTALFVAVRVPDQPGPPLAAKRLASRVPVEVELTPADAMVPGRSFSAGQQVEIVARLSRTGTANAATGDPVGRLRYDVGKDGVRELVIDQLTP